MWRWADVKMSRCEDEKVWRWEGEIQTPTIGRTLRSDALGNKNPASEATRLQWNIRKVCELFQTLASGTAVSSSGMSSASKTGCSSSRSSSFNVWPAQVSQSKPSLEKTWRTLMHRITCFYLCALEAFADTVPSLRVTKGGQKSERQISAQFLSSSSWPLPAPLLLLGHQAYPLSRIWSQGVGKQRETNYPIGSNLRDKNARPNIYCQVLWWNESPWMQSCLNLFVAPDRQSPWACDLKQGSIFTKSKGGFHPNMANWPVLQLLQPLDKSNLGKIGTQGSQSGAPDLGWHHLAHRWCCQCTSMNPLTRWIATGPLRCHL